MTMTATELAQALAAAGDAPGQIEHVTFDGFHFAAGPLFADLVPLLGMAHRARRGDTVAAELLDKFGIEIVGTDLRRYWPVTPTTP
jgi:hypothetical protein